MQESIFKRFFKRNDSSAISATVVLFILFALSSSSFLNSYNIFNVLRNMSLYLFVALGQAMVIVVSGMNLSLGAIGGLAVLACGMALDIYQLPGIAAIFVSLLVGCAAGFFNGIVIAKLKLNSFVVTLATSFIFTGLVLGISKGYPFTGIPKTFTAIGRGSFGSIPYLFILMLVTLFIVFYVFKYTVLGRHLLATGGNLEAARLSGIKTDRMIITANLLSGLFASLAGILWVSRMGSAQPATGQDWLITSFAVAVIGGTNLKGGTITVIGLFASALMITFIKNGLVMLEVNVYYEQTFLGLIILLAVTVEMLRMKYIEKSKNALEGGMTEKEKKIPDERERILN